MPNFIQRNLNQTATYWARGAPDGYGGYVYEDPVEISCRWSDTTELFIDRAGQEQRSQAVVVLDQDVEVGDYLYLGSSSSTAPNTLEGAYEVRSWKKIPNLHATIYLRKAFL